MGEARGRAAVRMAAEARTGIVRLASDVRRRDRRAECLMRRDDVLRSGGQMAGVAARLREIELCVLPSRVDQSCPMALVARGEVATGRRIDPENRPRRARLAVRDHEPCRPGIVSVTEEASRRSAITQTDRTQPEPWI